jgi:hypothetical protein
VNRWPAEELVAEVEHLTRNGSSPRDTATRLGTTLSAIAQATTRAGRPDLAKPFEKARNQDRMHPCLDCDTLVVHGALRCRPHGFQARSAAARGRAS